MSAADLLADTPRPAAVGPLTIDRAVLGRHDRYRTLGRYLDALVDARHEPCGAAATFRMSDLTSFAALAATDPDTLLTDLTLLGALVR